MVGRFVGVNSIHATAMAYVDLYLARIRTPRHQLQLVGTACLFIASKVRSREGQYFALDSLSELTLRAFSTADILVSFCFLSKARGADPLQTRTWRCPCCGYWAGAPTS